MAVTDRGLPSVPRGLDRDLTFFLQNLVNVIGRLSGLSPGSATTRAVRVKESVVVLSSTSKTGTTTSSGTFLPGIADGAVTTAKIADGAVTQRKIADYAVGETELAPNSVSSSKIGNGEVTTEKLNSGCVTTDKIADGSITADKIAGGVIPVIPPMPEIPEIPKELPPTDYSVTYEKLAKTGTVSRVEGTASHGELVVLPNRWQMKPCVAVQYITESVNGQCGVPSLDEIEDGVWAFVGMGAFSYVATGYVLEEGIFYIPTEPEPEEPEEGTGG